ncbi:hypothetical protein Lpp70_09902, partial [Lacticaseibacillus paracasei subsp. paracasei Lpp70]
IATLPRQSMLPGERYNRGGRLIYAGAGDLWSFG